MSNGSSDDVTAAQPARSRTFTVGVTAPGISGGGHLFISPDALICELGPIARKVAGIERVQHKGKVVHVYRALFVPFWFNIAALIDDGTSKVQASMWWFGLGTLIGALNAAGYSVELHKTRVFRGLRYTDMKPGRRKPSGGE